MATASTPPLLPRVKRMRFNDPVRIQVGTGDDCEIFTIDAEILISRSLFFRKAFSGNFKEAKERLIKLPEDDPEIFAIYLHFVNTNELCVLPDMDEEVGEDPSDFHFEMTTSLVELYVLAEKLQDVRAKNGIMRGIIASYIRSYPPDDTEWLLSASAVTRIYDGTPPGSMARRVAVEYQAWEGVPDDIRSNEWPHEFLSDLAFELMTFEKGTHDKTGENWRRDHPENYMEEETKE